MRKNQNDLLELYKIYYIVTNSKFESEIRQMVNQYITQFDWTIDLVI